MTNINALVSRAVKATADAREAWEAVARALDPNQEEVARLKAEAEAIANRTRAIDKRLRDLLNIKKGEQMGSIRRS